MWNSLPLPREGVGLGVGYQKRTVTFKQKGFQCWQQSGFVFDTLIVVPGRCEMPIYHLLVSWISHAILLSPDFLVSKVGVRSPLQMSAVTVTWSHSSLGLIELRL